MFELHTAIAAIRVKDKTFADICTKIPIADIFHSGRRRRRDVVTVNAAAADISTNGSVALPTVTDDGPTLEVDKELSEGKTEAVAELEAAKEAAVEDHYDSLWADYDYSEDIKAKVDLAKGRLRIDFAKYGPKVAGQKRVDDDKVELPDDIYCDLIDSLNDVCLQSSLLEIWRYDR